MNRKHYTTYRPLTKVLTLILAVLVFVSSWLIATEVNRIHAESVYATEWVICKDYVLIRQWPSRKAPECGQLDPCDDVEIDGKTKDGFAHIVSPVDGWIWAGNLVESKPEAVNLKGYVTAKNRVACRRWVDGPQAEINGKPSWLVNGSEVKIFYMSEEWACTSRGYIKSEWLEVCAE